jgi:hypothetical protein
MMLLHGKQIQTPKSLTAAHIACIQIQFDLICAPPKLHGDPVMALVHILVDVLDGLDRCNGLHIDVALILPDEKPGVTDHPTIVNLLAFDKVRVASVATPGASIGVLSHHGLLPEALGKALRTFVIDHAGCLGIVDTAR